MGKLPAEANLVFKGKIFEVYQWEQTQFDGSKSTFEMLKRPNTVIILAVVGDKLVICEEEQPSKPPFLALPGGRVEQGEDNLVAAKRELLEETGLTSDNWEHLYTTSPASKIDWQISAYIARNCSTTGKQNLDSGEKINVKLVDFDTFINLFVEGKMTEYKLETDILRMKLDPTLMTEFKHKLLGNA